MATTRSKIVYHARSTFEATFLRDLLAQEGITAWMLNQSALQWSSDSMVHLRVLEEDAVRAQKIILRTNTGKEDSPLDGALSIDRSGAKAGSLALAQGGELSPAQSACATCGAEREEGFALCWQCGADFA